MVLRGPLDQIGCCVRRAVVDDQPEIWHDRLIDHGFDGDWQVLCFISTWSDNHTATALIFFTLHILKSPRCRYNRMLSACAA